MGAHHHVVADRQTEPGSLSRRLCREKGLPCPASPPECRRRCRGCGSRLRLPSSLVLTCNSGENAGVDCVLAVRQCSSQTHPTPGHARNPTFPSLITLASAQTCPIAATPSRLGTSCIEAVQGVPKKKHRAVYRDEEYILVAHPFRVRAQEGIEIGKKRLRPHRCRWFVQGEKSFNHGSAREGSDIALHAQEHSSMLRDCRSATASRPAVTSL